MKSVPVKSLLLLFKIALMMVSLFVIYNRVTIKENIADFIADTQLLTQSKSVFLLLILIVLMFINWFSEALKWKYLIDKIYSIKISEAWWAVLSGVTVSFFTPNRIGEFAGRILHLPEGIRLKATLITFIGNAAQLLCTLVFGITALLFCLPNFFELSTLTIALVSASLSLFSGLLLLLYFRINLLETFLQKFNWLQKFALQTSAFNEYSKADLGLVLLLSAFRYVIFTTQFVIMLWLFDSTINFYNLYKAVAIVYLVITIVPTIAFSELAIRGSVAVSVISLFGGNSLHILEASFLLWLINLVLPAVAGSLTLLTLKFSNND